LNFRMPKLLSFEPAEASDLAHPMATQRRALLALCFTLAGVLAAGVEDEFGIQPEIVHQFRPQEKMPPKIVSQFASLLVLAPWIALLAGVSY
jgi:hypothetical protein